MNQWDIFEAVVPYREDITKAKTQPVLIVSDKECLVLKMTTHHHSDKPKPYEYEVARWKESGQTARTYIQCDHFVRLSLSHFTGRQYGRLQMADIIGVKAMMKFHGLIK